MYLVNGSVDRLVFDLASVLQLNEKIVYPLYRVAAPGVRDILPHCILPIPPVKERIPVTDRDRKADKFLCLFDTLIERLDRADVKARIA